MHSSEYINILEHGILNETMLVYSLQNTQSTRIRDNKDGTQRDDILVLPYGNPSTDYISIVLYGTPRH